MEEDHKTWSNRRAKRKNKLKEDHRFRSNGCAKIKEINQ